MSRYEGTPTRENFEIYFLFYLRKNKLCVIVSDPRLLISKRKEKKTGYKMFWIFIFLNGGYSLQIKVGGVSDVCPNLDIPI
jgi:hypothetical protein